MPKTTQSLESMSLAQLTETYNKYAAKPVKKFSCSREAAIAKVKAVMPKRTAKQGVGAVTIECLQKGMKPAEVLEQLRKTFGEAVGSIKAIYWYASRLNRGLI